MRVLVDTNVLMDYLANREPYADDAHNIIMLCVSKEIDGCIAAHTITNLFYILRKEMPVLKRKAALKTLCRVFDVVGITNKKLDLALNNEDFDDLEDCLQDECAKDYNAEYIITRNEQDFENGTTITIEPSEFLKIFRNSIQREVWTNITFYEVWNDKVFQYTKSIDESQWQWV